MAGHRARRLGAAFLLAACGAAGAARPASGADIQVAQAANGTPLVYLSGRMVPEDVAAFLAAAERLPGPAAVVLDSPGGSAVVGIQIGRAIRQRGFATLVPEGPRCASACALAWLGGVPRYMVHGSAVGFHAAYTMEAGQAATSGVGNALIGGYLAQLGLRDRAIVYITQARPEQMTWLDPDAAVRTGIEVTILAPPRPGPDPAAPVRRAAAAATTAAPPRPPGAAPAEPAPAAPRVFRPIAGPVHRGVLRVEGRGLPLPPGDWIEISRRERRGEGAGPQETEVGLVRASAAGVDAFVALRTADHPRAAGRPALWGSSAVCTRTDTLARLVAVHTDAANACAALNYAVAAPGGPAASETWNAFLSLYPGREGFMPGTMISVSYRFAGPRGATNVGYYFGVEAYGFPRSAAGRADSPWQRGSLNDERRAHLHRLHAWMRAGFDAVKAGVEGGGGEAEMPLPNP